MIKVMHTEAIIERVDIGDGEEGIKVIVEFGVSLEMPSAPYKDCRINYAGHEFQVAGIPVYYVNENYYKTHSRVEELEYRSVEESIRRCIEAGFYAVNINKDYQQLVNNIIDNK
jgi:hypothetical protein